MKKVFGVLCVLIVLAGVLAGCSGGKEHSSSRLNVSDNLDSFDEAKQVADMATPKDIAFAIDGSSDYCILVCTQLSDENLQSCQDLSDILNKMLGSGEQFEIVNTVETGEKFISIGDTEQAVAQNFDKSKIVYDGFAIKTDNNGNIYIFANEEGGISNGIFTMLEDVFGCMFVRDDFDYIPNYQTIYLDKMDIVNNPDFEWRRMFQYEVSENRWYKKIKSNGASSLGVEVNAEWGTWCHSVFTFVDPDIYLKIHPEYFVIVDGEPKQLCLTNPDIYPIISAKMRQLMAEQPDKKYWDFSLNDNYDYCKCPNCKKVLEETGSMMGTMLPIINRLAKEFPDKTISTLAYFYNKEVPRGIVCEENVNIVVAPIATGQLYTYKNGDTPKAAQAKQLISDWGKVAKSVFVWDYVVDFSNLLLPFPNFDVQKDNHDFYLQNNVKAVFHQGSREHTNELACLRSYVFSKQMWDNSVDTNKLIAKYLKVTYGKAAPFIAEYLDTMNNELRDKAKDLDLYDSAAAHRFDYLSNKNIDNYTSLMLKAEQAEQGNQAVLDRIAEIKINVVYAKMVASGLNIFEKQQAFEEFKVLADKLNIERHAETGMKIDEYINEGYPKTLRNIKIYISLAAILPVIAVVCGIVTFVLVRKK